MPSNVRQIALSVLLTLDQGHQTLDQLMEDAFAQKPEIPRRDRALLSALVFGTVRWRSRLDWIIDYFSKIRLDKIDRPVLTILRLGLFQMFFMDRIPQAAAVNTSAELAKTVGGRWVVGFVNAILRNAGRKIDHVPFPDPKDDPLSALAVRKAFPPWLLDRWMRRFGLPETIALCDAMNSIPPITVRTNTLKCSRHTLQKALKAHVGDLQLLPYAPDGIALTRPETALVDFNPFKHGWFQVQDEAAQLISLLLGPHPGEKILDACAGLGGKTAHLAQLMKNQGHILATDLRQNKLGRLRAEMHRLGISIVQPLAADLNRPLIRLKTGKFDRILLDAPCSGLGVLRRNPDIKWVLSKKNLKYYNIGQTKLLENVAALLKPCGTLVYAVCSLEPEENEQVVEPFLKRHPDFKLVRMDMPFLTAGNLTDEQGYFKSYPHRVNMDGFFAARLERMG